MEESLNLLSLAINQHRGGQVAQAVEEYRSTLEAAPDVAAGWHFLGAALHQLGDSDAAAESVRRATAGQAIQSVRVSLDGEGKFRYEFS